MRSIEELQKQLDARKQTNLSLANQGVAENKDMKKLLKMVKKLLEHEGLIEKPKCKCCCNKGE